MTRRSFHWRKHRCNPMGETRCKPRLHHCRRNLLLHEQVRTSLCVVGRYSIGSLATSTTCGLGLTKVEHGEGWLSFTYPCCTIIATRKKKTLRALQPAPFSIPRERIYSSCMYKSTCMYVCSKVGFFWRRISVRWGQAHSFLLVSLVSGWDGLNGKLFAPPPCGVTDGPRGQKVTCPPGECVAALVTQNNG